MKFFTLFFSFFFINTLIFATDNKPSDDAVIRQIFSEYQKALITKDVAASKKCFVSKEEFQAILEFVKTSQPNCIGTDEEKFTTELNDEAFKSIITVDNILVKQVFVNRIEYNNSCGDLLTIPRVICTVQYNDNKTVEVPFLLIKTISGEYKIIRNFLSIKMFSL